MGHGSGCKRSGSATLSLVSLSLVLLLASPAGSRSETDDRLAPQDTVEIRVSGWTALRGGVAEASILTDVFTIGTTGSLELPIVGHVPAAGLRADELAKLITDRLQARSGLSERPVTTVQLKQNPSSAVSSAGSRAERQQALEQGSSKADALLRDLSATRKEADAVRKEAEAARKEALAARQAARDAAVRYNLGLAEARQRAAALTQELSAARADLEAAKAQVAQERNAASRAQQAASVFANEKHELASRERAKSAALEQSLDCGAPRNPRTQEQPGNSR